MDEPRNGSTVEASTASPPNLLRVLGRWDLVLLFVVAIFNLNVIPSIAANGGVTIWLWIISVLFFLWPQGVVVIELAHRYPGEGGVYLWAKKIFGDFHGFLSGWCYWTTNMMYVPTVMLYFVGVSVFVLGYGHENLVENKLFTFSASFLFLGILVILNIVGLGVGKWINNVGATGTGLAALVIIGLSLAIWLRFGTALSRSDFQVPASPHGVLNSFGLICFGLVGLELASVMGDEIKDPQKNLPGAVALGGIVAGLLYIITTMALLVSVKKQDINAIQGIIETVGYMTNKVGIAWIIGPFALLLTVSIAGIGSVWLGGSARIPFVAGLDSYLPAWMGRIHPKYATPYAALITHATVSMLLVAMNLAGAGIQESFQRLLSLAVVLQLIPFVYMFGAVLKISLSAAFRKNKYSRGTLILSGASGLMTSLLGVGLAFFPGQQIISLRAYEAWMIGGTLSFICMARLLFAVYDKRKGTAEKIAALEIE